MIISSWYIIVSMCKKKSSKTFCSFDNHIFFCSAWNRTLTQSKWLSLFATDFHSLVQFAPTQSGHFYRIDRRRFQKWAETDVAARGDLGRDSTQTWQRQNEISQDRQCEQGPWLYRQQRRQACLNWRRGYVFLSKLAAIQSLSETRVNQCPVLSKK